MDLNNISYGAMILIVIGLAAAAALAALILDVLIITGRLFARGFRQGYRRSMHGEDYPHDQ